MGGNVVMRCGMDSVVLAEVDGSGGLSNVQSYAVAFDRERGNTEDWLQAFAKTVTGIAKETRQKIALIIPPNSEIFIKHLKIPELGEKSAREAFRFECEHAFPGGSEEWSWDIYQTGEQTTHAFGVAIRRVVSERIIDILISNKIQFSYICPEIFLNTVAIQNYTDSPQNSMVVHIGNASAYLTCIGSNVEYFRVLPIAGSHLTKTIAEAQKLSEARAESLQVEFLENPANENRTFMAYYAKQFSQKLRQELKKSELFYCRTFKQNPTAKLYITGSRGKLYEFFKAEEGAEVVDMFEALKNSIGTCIGEAEIDLIKRNIGAFVGAAYCLKNGQAKPLNLFSADFSDQVEFQRQHLGYLLVMVLLTLAALTGLKVLTKDAINLGSAKAAMEAKLFETNIDIARYSAAREARDEVKAFIENTKAALDSQAAWVDFLNDLQLGLQALQTAWIESFTWVDKTDGTGATNVEIVAKMLFVDDASKFANGKIEKFISSLAEMKGVEHVGNIRTLARNGHSLSFAFDLALRKQSEIFMK
ncbi:MAG: hypothetical protein LBI61_04115 [Puniceicoccales bacterium]|jgi:Tfp pilus assembly PilM family ATPase|nr:hypothetical protein [Puniceicoccales bacterium]